MPLSAFTHFVSESESLSINHQGQFPAATISFNLNTGYSLSQALDAINKVIAQDKLPPSVVSNYQGTAAAYEGSQSNEGLLILAALVTVYIVLGVLYESFIHPITILSRCLRPVSVRCLRWSSSTSTLISSPLSASSC